MDPREKSTYAVGPFLLDLANRRLTQRGEPIPLSVKAVQVLACLVTRAGHLVTREELLAEVWPGEAINDNNVSVQIGALRRVLGTDPDYIETVPRRGYRFIGPVSVIGATDGHTPTPEVIDRPDSRWTSGTRGILAVTTLAVALLAAAYWATRDSEP